MNTNNFTAMLEFLKTQQLCTIATNRAGGSPESALVAFAQDEQLHIYFQTGRHTRKAQNLAQSLNVSFVFGLTLETGITMQYEGRAEQLHDSTRIAACKRLFLDRNSPTTAEFLEHPTSIFFEVTPTWIGMSDYRGKKPVVIEEFFD